MNNKVYKKKGQTVKNAATGVAIGLGCAAYAVAAILGVAGIGILIQGWVSGGLVCIAVAAAIVIAMKVIPTKAENTVADIRFNKNDMMQEIISKIPQPFSGEIWTASDGIRVNEKVYKFKDFGYDKLDVGDYRSLAEWAKRHVVWTDPKNVVVERVTKDHYSGSRSYGTSPTTYYETDGGHLGVNMNGAGANTTSTLFKVYIKDPKSNKKPDKLKSW